VEKTVIRIRVWNWVVTAAVVAAGVGVWLVFGKKLPPEVPLLYSRPWGESQLVKPYWLLILPGMAGIIGTAIGVAVKKLGNDMPLIVMVLGTSIATQLVLILGMLRIVLFIL